MQNHFVYILYSKSRKIFYVGMTINVKDRIKQHNAGESTFTSSGIPWDMIWCTVKEDKELAKKLERKIKNLTYQKKISFMEKYKVDIVDQKLFYELY